MLPLARRVIARPSISISRTEDQVCRLESVVSGGATDEHEKDRQSVGSLAGSMDGGGDSMEGLYSEQLVTLSLIDEDSEEQRYGDEEASSGSYGECSGCVPSFLPFLDD